MAILIFSLNTLIFILRNCLEEFNNYLFIRNFLDSGNIKAAKATTKVSFFLFNQEKAYFYPTKSIFPSLFPNKTFMFETECPTYGTASNRPWI